MKLVTYRYNEEIRPGVLSSDGTAVFSAEALGYEAADMNQFIDRLEMTGLPALKAALEHADPAKAVPFRRLRFWRPFRSPSRT